MDSLKKIQTIIPSPSYTAKKLIPLDIPYLKRYDLNNNKTPLTEDKFSKIKSNLNFPDKLSGQTLMDKLLSANSNKFNPNIKNIIPKQIFTNNKIFNQTIPFLEEESLETLIKRLPEELELVSDLSKLSISARRELLKFLVKANSRLFQYNIDLGKGVHNLKSSYDAVLQPAYALFPLLPKNEQQYCSLMQELVKSVGINVNPVTKEQRADFFLAIQSMKETLPSVNLDTMQINLRFSREEFIQQSQEVLSRLSQNDKDSATNFYGFNIKGNLLTGYPYLDGNFEANFAKIKDKSVQQAIQQLKPLVERFIHNHITLSEEFKGLEADLNKIFTAVPELYTTIGKKQHMSHPNTLDIHLLKVLQSVYKHPDYQSLSDTNKTIILTSALLHDIAKAEGVVDKMHPFESSFDAYYIARKLGFSDYETDRISSLVKNHHWLERFNSDNTVTESDLEKFAFEFRYPEMFKMAKIFALSDLQGISDSFVTRFSPALNSAKVQSIENKVNTIISKGIYLPQTRIPSASDLNIEPTTIGKGNNVTTNKVVILNKINDLESIGFPKGTLKNFFTMVHVVDDNKSALNILEALSQSNNEGVVSTSYIDKNNFETYYGRNQGVLLEFDPLNVVEALNSNLSSGNKKDLNSQIDILFKKKAFMRMKEGRDFVSDNLKQALNLTDQEYIEFYNKLVELEDITNVPEEVQAKIIAAVSKLLKNPILSHNEVTVFAPTIKAVFIKNTEIQNISYDLRKYAQDNDLPIVVFGNVY